MIDSFEPGSRDDLIARLLSGEISASDETVLAAMRDEPGFAKEVEELLSFEEGVRATVPLDVSEDEPWPGADRQIASMVEQRLGSPRSSRRRFGWMAVAAALLIGLLLWQPWALPTAPPDRTLGQGELAPKGDVGFDEFLADGFRWNLEVPVGEELWLAIELDGQTFGAPISVTGRSHLAVPDALRVLRPNEMYWRVYYSPAGGRRKSWDADVSFR